MKKNLTIRVNELEKILIESLRKATLNPYSVLYMLEEESKKKTAETNMADPFLHYLEEGSKKMHDIIMDENPVDL
ncbi:MAG: hypothetical protein PHT77_13095 [Bacteroidales bacterium]|nr:hypothetical protein [Bacteroidales bacterium]